MRRVLRQMWFCRREQSDLPVAADAHVLVHACGEVLLGADGEPLEFPSAESAERFALRFLCEPAFMRRATSATSALCAA